MTAASFIESFQACAFRLVMLPTLERVEIVSTKKATLKTRSRSVYVSIEEVW